VYFQLLDKQFCAGNNLRRSWDSGVQRCGREGGGDGDNLVSVLNHRLNAEFDLGDKVFLKQLQDSNPLRLDLQRDDKVSAGSRIRAVFFL
jgi:hypothetical protein